MKYQIKILFLLYFSVALYPSWLPTSTYGLGWNIDPQSQEEVTKRLKDLEQNKIKHDQIKHDQIKAPYNIVESLFANQDLPSGISLEDIFILYKYFMKPNYPLLHEGFALLGQDFYVFIRDVIMQYTGPDISEEGFDELVSFIVDKAQNQIIQGMKKDFLRGLYKAIKNNNVNNVENKRFQYVIKAADGGDWMKSPVSQWVTSGGMEFVETVGLKFEQEIPENYVPEDYIPLLVLVAYNAYNVLKFLLNTIRITPWTVNYVDGNFRERNLLGDSFIYSWESNSTQCRQLLFDAAKPYVDSKLLNEMMSPSYHDKVFSEFLQKHH